MDLYKYRVYCIDEGKYYEFWDSPDATLYCPTNSSHSLDSDQTIVIDKIVDTPPTDKSGKPRVHSTPRPLGNTLYICGEADDPTNVNAVGGGPELLFTHNIGDPLEQSYYFDFNIIENETWLQDGFIAYKDADFDTISLELVVRTVSYTTGTNTNYNLYGGYLVIPAAGDGTIDITSDLTDPNGGLVFMPTDDLGNARPGFWNADWNSTTNKFENITPAPDGTGQYNMYAVEISLGKFCRNIPLVGTGVFAFDSHDVTQLGHGMRFKITTKTRSPDHNWKAAGGLTFYRKSII